MRLRARLLLTHAVLVLAVVLATEFAVRSVLAGNLERSLLREISGAAALAASGLPESSDPTAVDPVADAMGSALGHRVTVIAPDGRVLGDSEFRIAELADLENHAARPEVIAARSTGLGTEKRWSASVRDELLYAAVARADGRVVRVAESTAEIRGATAAARRRLLATAGGGLLLSLVFSLALSSTLARPIAELTHTARAMAAGELERRTTPPSGDELGELANALNDLAGSFALSIRQVTAERNRLSGILAGMVEGVLVVDSTGRVVLLNPSLREILSIQGDVAGRTVLEAVRSAELHEAIARVLAGGDAIARTLTVHGAAERTMEVRFSVLRNDERETPGIAGLVAVFHDVTELKRLEQVRRDFVSNASHELKTPVAAILGASETLTGGAIDDREAGPRFLSSISRNAARLAALVEDLLDLSRLESRGVSEALREVRPSDALVRAASLFRDIAEKKHIKLEVAPSPDIEGVRGDPTLMERALSNLVQNAVRYTPEGGRVRLRAVREGEAVRFEVTDTGIGIPPAALPRIWERFYRVDPARSRELGGTGLGLAIVKHAVEAMGGRVAVESTAGRGSTFSFTLPSWE